MAFSCAGTGHKEYTARAIEYDRLYFDDMNFEAGSITGSAFDYKRFPECLPDGSEIIRNKPHEITEAIIKDCRFHIRRLDDGADGNCNGWNITIAPSSANNHLVILHEMLHVHIKIMPDVYKEYFIICLYKKLKRGIKRLDELLSSHANFLRLDSDMYVHGPLFFLKSLDIDLRLGLSLGSVFGYGVVKGIPQDLIKKNRQRNHEQQGSTALYIYAGHPVRRYFLAGQNTPEGGTLYLCIETGICFSGRKK
jgi:hypothetical protein